MRVDLDKNFDKNEFNTIKTTIGYPPKSDCLFLLHRLQIFILGTLR